MTKPVRKVNLPSQQETVHCRGITSSTGAPCKQKIKLSPGTTPQQYFCHHHRNQQLNRFGTRRNVTGEVSKYFPPPDNSVKALTEDVKNLKIKPTSNSKKSTTNQPPTKPVNEKPTTKKKNFFSNAKIFFGKLKAKKSSSPGLSKISDGQFFNNHNPHQTKFFPTPSQTTQNNNYHTPNLMPSPTQHVFGRPSFKFDPTPTSVLHHQQVVICRGVKRSGQPCTMKVRLPPASEIVESSYYCRHHREQEQSIDMSSQWLQSWMPQDISGETMHKLRMEMSKPISEGDQPGFIYAYQTEELRSDGLRVHNFYKIGRTNNLPRRLYQWHKGCGKLVKLIESFPAAVSSSTNTPNLQSPYSHRLERLIHIHLGDRYKVEPFYCVGCSRYHTEWFMVPHSAQHQGKYPGWPEIREIIQHWLRFVYTLQTSQG